MNVHWRQYVPTDVADWVQFAVLVLAVYGVLRLVRGTIAATLLRGTVILVTLAVFMTSVVLRLFELRVLHSILNALLGTTALAMLIVFQPELRRALLSLGQHRFFGRFRQRPRGAIDVIARTVQTLSRERRGALFAIERSSVLQHIADTGTRLDAQATPELLASIFWPGSPLHDGGVVIRGERVVAAACIFPLAERRDLDSRLGTRHRAGIGLSEECDAVVVIVSEETGRVCVTSGGEFKFVDPDTELLAELEMRTGVAQPPNHFARAQPEPAADQSKVTVP
jgi:diadenylate cyclase